MFFIKVSHHVLNLKLKWEYNCHIEVSKWFIIEHYWFCTLNRQECYKLKKVPSSTKHKTVSVVNKVPEEQRKRYLFYLFFRTLHNLLKGLKILKMEDICYNEFTVQELRRKSILRHKLKGPCPKPNCRMIFLNCYCSWGQLILKVIHCGGCIHLKCLIKDFYLACLSGNMNLSSYSHQVSQSCCCRLWLGALLHAQKFQLATKTFNLVLQQKKKPHILSLTDCRVPLLKPCPFSRPRRGNAASGLNWQLSRTAEQGLGLGPDAPALCLGSAGRHRAQEKTRGPSPRRTETPQQPGGHRGEKRPGQAAPPLPCLCVSLVTVAVATSLPARGPIPGSGGRGWRRYGHCWTRWPWRGWTASRRAPCGTAWAPARRPSRCRWSPPRSSSSGPRSAPSPTSASTCCRGRARRSACTTGEGTSGGDGAPRPAEPPPLAGRRAFPFPPGGRPPPAGRAGRARSSAGDNSGPVLQPPRRLPPPLVLRSHAGFAGRTPK